MSLRAAGCCAPSCGGCAVGRRTRRSGGNRGADRGDARERHPDQRGPAGLLANILKLRDKTVADVMVPRVDIVGIAADTPLDEVVRLIQAEAHSRYPIYRESLDDVIGMYPHQGCAGLLGHLQEVQSPRHPAACRVRGADPAGPGHAARHAAVAHPHGTRGRRIRRQPTGCSPSRISSRRSWARSRTSTTSRRPRPSPSRRRHDRRQWSNADRTARGGDRKVLSEDERREIDTVGGLIFSLLGRIPERGGGGPPPVGHRVRDSRRRSKTDSPLRVRAPTAEPAAK